jgi:hypothetical protein
MHFPLLTDVLSFCDSTSLIITSPMGFGFSYTPHR